MNPAQSTRQPIDGDNTGTALDACRQMLAVLPTAGALFDADGCCVGLNQSFRDRFPQLGMNPTLDAFCTMFDPVIVESGNHHVQRCDNAAPFQISRHTPLESLPDHALILATPVSGNSENRRDQQARQERLLATSRMMSVGEMTTTLAHELNQPLASIINYLGACSQMLERGDTGNPRLVQGIQLAHGQAMHASEVVTRLREFVRAREPKRTAQPAQTLLDNVLTLVEADAAEGQIHISTSVPEDLPQVFADRVMVEQVLLNLVKNAIDAMRDILPEQRQLAIDVDIDLDGMLRFRVTDTGCGLDEDNANDLFTPLYTTKPDGMGMGLAICRSIIEYHAGRLYAEPNPDGGCVFVFTLPAADDPTGDSA